MAVAACGPQADKPAEPGPAAPAAEAAPSAELIARLDAMPYLELNIAAGEADGGFASDLARYSNIAATAAACGWSDVDFAPKLEARFKASALDADKKALMRRFYERTLAADTASLKADDPASVCTAENREAHKRIHAEW